MSSVSIPTRTISNYSRFLPKPSENTCSVYDTEENELVTTKNGKNISIVWKVGGFTKRKFSFQGDHHCSLPLLFTDGTCNYVAIGTWNRLIIFDELGNESFWPLDSFVSSTRDVCIALWDLSWAIILSWTPNNKYDEVVYLLFHKKQKRLYLLSGIHRGEHIVYGCSDLPLLVTWDEVLDTLSLLVCNETKIPDNNEDSKHSVFVDRLNQTFQATPKELCCFHDELGQLYLAILDQYSYLYFLQVPGASWSRKKQNHLQLETLQWMLMKKAEDFTSIQSLIISREEFYDLLCLDKMGTCHVYVGCQWILQFQIFSVDVESSLSIRLLWSMGAKNDKEEEENCTSAKQNSLKCFKDPVAFGITLEYHSTTYRISLDCFRPHTQPTKDMLICAFAALKPEWACVLRSLWIFHKFQLYDCISVSLDHCLEWKSLEQSLDVLKKYVLGHSLVQGGSQNTCLNPTLLSSLLMQLSSSIKGNNITKQQVPFASSCDDYSLTNYLTSKYSLFCETWQIPFPSETNKNHDDDNNNNNNSFHSSSFEALENRPHQGRATFRDDSAGETLLYALANVFHLLYECYKTFVTKMNHLELIARQVRGLISLLGLSAWMEHYNGDWLTLTGNLRNCSSSSSYCCCCCILDALSSAMVGSFQDLTVLKKNIQNFSFRGIYNPLQRLETICHIMESIFLPNDSSPKNMLSLVVEMRDMLPSLPSSISIPIYDALQVESFYSHEDDDIGSNLQHWDNASSWLLLGMETKEWNQISQPQMESMEDELIVDFDSSNYVSGMEMNDPWIDMRFAADRRIIEVRNLLDSASPITLDSMDLKTLYDATTLSANKLLAMLLKNLGVCIGRGAFALATCVSVDPTESIVIPKICLAAKAPSDSLPLIKLDTSIVSSHYFDWPRFHNGVAASLRLFKVQEPSDISPEITMLLSRSWIVSNRPSKPCASHAGVLFGLGLTGQLPVLQTTDWYGYLVGRDELTCVGLILGVACSARGSLDNSATKMLCIHIRHFNPLSFSQPDWEVPVSVQSAACLGLGILYRSSCHRLMVEGLYAEMTRKMEPDIPLGERQGFCLAAGFGLGFVCLGMGRKSTALQDLHLEEKLYACIYGKTTMTTNVKGISQNIHSDTFPNIILEEYPNRDVSTPAALMALCLMYLQTNDTSVANMLTIPETYFELESIRPDHLYLFVLCRQLILWDSIYATPRYLTSLLPDIIWKQFCQECSEEPSIDSLLDTLLGQLRENRDPNTSDNVLVVGTIMILLAGAMSIGLRYAGTYDAQAYHLIHRLFLGLEKIIPTSISIYLGLLPLSMSLIMAGTGHLHLLRLLRRIHRHIHRHYSSSDPTNQHHHNNNAYAHYMMNSMAIGFLFLGGGSCSFQTNSFAIACLLCALYPIFPVSPTDNQYHLQAFRHLYTLATENRLLTTRDIRTNKPCFVPLEITLKENKDYYSSTWRWMSPCLLPDWRMVERIQVRGPRYIPMTLYEHHNNHSNPKNSCMKIENGRRVALVRRRMGQLDYDKDPKGNRGLLSRAISWKGQGEMMTKLFHSLPGKKSIPWEQNQAIVDIREEIAMESLVEYPSLSGFLEYFCNSTDNPRIYDAILFQVLASDKPEALPLYLEMMNICNSMEKWSCLSMKHFHLVSRYFHYRPFFYKKQSPNRIQQHEEDDILPIIEPSFVEMCFHRVKQQLESKPLDWSRWFSEMTRQEEETTQTNEIVQNKWLSMYIQLLQIPPISILGHNNIFSQDWSSLLSVPSRYQQSIPLLWRYCKSQWNTKQHE